MPYIHAEYQGKVAVYAIEDGTVLAGRLPKNRHKLVVACIEIHQEDLAADWQLAVAGSKPFPKIHNGKYFIEWACGADLSADTIEAHWK